MRQCKRYAEHIFPGKQVKQVETGPHGQCGLLRAPKNRLTPIIKGHATLHRRTQEYYESHEDDAVPKGTEMNQLLVHPV